MNNQQNERPSKPFLTRPEAAKILGVSKSKIDRMIELGQVKSARIGDRTMLRSAELLALVEGNVTASSAPPRVA